MRVCPIVSPRSYSPRRSSRHKGKRAVRVYDTSELLIVFECADRATLIAKLNAHGMRYHVRAGDGFVAMSDRDFPEDLKCRARSQIIPSSWIMQI